MIVKKKHVLKNKFLYLLVSLLLFFMVNPFLADNPKGLYVFGALFSILVFFSVYVIKHGKWLIIPGFFLAGFIILGVWVTNVFHVHALFLTVELMLISLFFLFTTGIVFYYVMQDCEVSFNTLCGAVCGYLLLGMCFSFVYISISHWQPAAFSTAHANVHNFDSQLLEFIYYSYVTLTTLGYGDITPVMPVAKTFAWMEAVIGQVYLTIWIARLVGLHIAQRGRKQA